MPQKHRKIVAVDFDGTIVTHEFPALGKPVPGAVEGMRRLHEAGCDLILWTMRSGKFLEHALAYLKQNDVILFGVNENPEQGEWTTSQKAYAHVYIDDAAFGCPLIYPETGERPFVNWEGIVDGILEGFKLLDR